MTSVRPPAGAQIVNGAGKYVIPALGEMHGHLAGANAQMNERILALNVIHGVLTGAEHARRTRPS